MTLSLPELAEEPHAQGFCTHTLSTLQTDCQYGGTVRPHTRIGCLFGRHTCSRKSIAPLTFPLPRRRRAPLRHFCSLLCIFAQDMTEVSVVSMTLKEGSSPRNAGEVMGNTEQKQRHFGRSSTEESQTLAVRQTVSHDRTELSTVPKARLRHVCRFRGALTCEMQHGCDPTDGAFFYV